ATQAASVGHAEQSGVPPVPEPPVETPPLADPPFEIPPVPPLPLAPITFEPPDAEAPETPPSGETWSKRLPAWLPQPATISKTRDGAIAALRSGRCMNSPCLPETRGTHIVIQCATGFVNSRRERTRIHVCA